MLFRALTFFHIYIFTFNLRRRIFFSFLYKCHWTTYKWKKNWNFRFQKLYLCVPPLDRTHRVSVCLLFWRDDGNSVIVPPVCACKLTATWSRSTSLIDPRGPPVRSTIAKCVTFTWLMKASWCGNSGNRCWGSAGLECWWDWPLSALSFHWADMHWKLEINLPLFTAGSCPHPSDDIKK